MGWGGLAWLVGWLDKLRLGWEGKLCGAAGRVVWWGGLVGWLV